MSMYCFYVFSPPPPPPLSPSSGLGSTPRVTISTLPILYAPSSILKLEQGAVSCPQNMPALHPSF